MFDQGGMMIDDGDLAQAVRGALAAAGLLGASTADGEDARAASAAPQPAPGRAAGEGGDAGSAHVWTRVVVLAMREVLRATGAPDTWGADDRERVVASLDDAARLIEAAKAPVLVAHEESGAWVRPGVRSFEAYRAAQGREDLGASRREAATARTVTALEGGVDAMARGELTSSQAQHLGRVADEVDPDTRSLLLQGEGAAKVRELARTHEPRRFARKVEELAASQRPAAVQDAHETIRARRYLRLRPGPGGTKIDGLLDPVAGHRLQLAIEAASPRPGAEDSRTLGQRNADALETIASAILTEGELSPSRHVPTQVMITMTAETFVAARKHLEQGSHRRGAALPPGAADDAAAEAAGAETVVGQAEGPGPAVAGDAAALAGTGATTDGGAQRRAVELRDQHCAWPSCTVRARYCEVHHLDHWDSDHGETDVHRGVLACSFHHHELHRHDLDLVAEPRPAGTAREGPPGPGALPGDPEYEPPVYTTVPRSSTADERRARKLARLRRDSAQRRERLRRAG